MNIKIHKSYVQPVTDNQINSITKMYKFIKSLHDHLIARNKIHLTSSIKTEATPKMVIHFQLIIESIYISI